MDVFLTVLGWIFVGIGVLVIINTLQRIRSIVGIYRTGGGKQAIIIFRIRFALIALFLSLGIWLAVFR
jgi:uncharacterized membrane protein